MYIPKAFAQPNVATMHTLMRAHPLATVITLNADGLNANHIPLHLDAAPAPFGTLRGHVARANPMLDDINTDLESLIVFQGPQTYITPAWYATKQETGKVAPTWNYAVVHAYGTVRKMDDPAWLRSQLDALTAHNETAFAEPWYVSDAPAEFIEQILAHIVGIEIVITRLLGKWKVNQNQPQRNQDSVIAGLRARGSENDLVNASLVETTNKRIDQ